MDQPPEINEIDHAIRRTAGITLRGTMLPTALQDAKAKQLDLARENSYLRKELAYYKDTHRHFHELLHSLHLLRDKITSMIQKVEDRCEASRKDFVGPFDGANYSHPAV